MKTKKKIEELLHEYTACLHDYERIVRRYEKYMEELTEPSNLSKSTMENTTGTPMDPRTVVGKFGLKYIVDERDDDWDEELDEDDGWDDEWADD